MNRFITTELIGKTSRLITNNLSQKILLAKIDITTEQWILLQILSKSSKTQKELGNITVKNKASINSLISYLLKQEYINKSISQKDKRETIIQITELGEDIRKMVLKEASEAINETMKGFSNSEIELLNSMLKRINNNLIK